MIILPKRITKTDYSKYITQFDIDMAKSIIHGMSLVVDQGYGVISMISLKEKDGFSFSTGDHRHMFSCFGDKMMNFAVEGESPFLNVDQFGKLLAKKLRRANFEEEIYIVLNVFNENIDESSEVSWAAINRVPDITHTWHIEEFFYLAAHAPFPAKAFVLPPGFSYVGDEVVKEYEDEVIDFPETIVREDETMTQSEELLSSIIGYTHDGQHALRIVWDNPMKGHESYSINFSKENNHAFMNVNDVMYDLLNRNLTLANMNHRMDNDGKFQIHLISSATSENEEVKEVEIRGWQVTGGNILSMDESKMEESVKANPLNFHKDAKTIYCDSWDYPISRVEVEDITSLVE